MSGVRGQGFSFQCHTGSPLILYNAECKAFRRDSHAWRGNRPNCRKKTDNIVSNQLRIRIRGEEICCWRRLWTVNILLPGGKGMKDCVTDCPEARILAVDDTPVNLHLLKTILSVHGYTVQSAPSGKYALKYLTDKSCDLPDMILLDIRMPQPDGYEVCRVLKNDDRTRDIPIIFISALNDTLDKVRAFSLGGVDYITKPFQPDEVLSRIRTHLHLQRMQKDLEKKNLQLEKEIEQRKQAEDALRRQSGELRERVQERDHLISELKNAIAQIKTLRGLLPICAGCKKIRNDDGYWEQIEVYIREHADVSFTHGICPDCKLRLYPPNEYPELYRKQDSGVRCSV